MIIIFKFKRIVIKITSGVRKARLVRFFSRISKPPGLTRSIIINHFLVFDTNNFENSKQRKNPALLYLSRATNTGTVVLQRQHELRHCCTIVATQMLIKSPSYNIQHRLPKSQAMRKFSSELWAQLFTPKQRDSSVGRGSFKGPRPRCNSTDVGSNPGTAA